MPNCNEVGMNFPCENIVINLGEMIAFDQISGLLPVVRIDGVDGIMTDQEARDLWDEV